MSVSPTCIRHATIYLSSFVTAERNECRQPPAHIPMYSSTTEIVSACWATCHFAAMRYNTVIAWSVRRSLPEKDVFYSSIWVVWLEQKQMVTTSVFPLRRGIGRGGGSARDLKSATDSKSAAPALLCEASCSGLILSESMRGGLGLWHTSRDSERLPRVPVPLLPLLVSIRVNLSWRKKGNK